MEVVLKKMGNTIALVLPPSALKNLGIRVGQHLTLDRTPDGNIVLTLKSKHILADMIAQCDLKAPPPADLALWDMARPAPGEAL
jgi:antitoxin ChpS